MRGSFSDSFEQVIRTLVDPDEFGDMRLQVHRYDNGEMAISLSRGEGREMRFWTHRLGLCEDIDSRHDRGKLCEWIRAEVRFLIALTKMQNGCIVVGKWRKWGRAA